MERTELHLSNIPITFIKIPGHPAQVRTYIIYYYIYYTYILVKLLKTLKSSDQSPLPSPRTTKTELNGDTTAVRTSVASNLRFTSELISCHNYYYRILSHLNKPHH